MYQIRIIPRTLHFKEPAGTSRGIYSTRLVRYVLLTNTQCPGKWGVGECAPLPGLSCDDLPGYDGILARACREAEILGAPPVETLRERPSILFGLETAFRHYEAGSFRLWETPFSRGGQGIPINGLIWMGDAGTMLERIEAKLAQGFKCLKLKIGAIGFDEELELLRHVRRRYSAGQIELRVDANGAFSPDAALDRLKRLAELDLHSIEQPIAAGQWEEMARLVQQSPLPIALDEELIGCNQKKGREELLQTIRPRYIILKPSLHGGITGCGEWIAEAERLGIGWWLTSALESNIGLNAIAQYAASLNTNIPQGLGTGALFTDNVPMPLSVKKDRLWFSPGDAAATRYDLEYKTEIAEQSLTIEGIPYQIDNFNLGVELRNFIAEWFDGSPGVSLQTSGSTGQPKAITASKRSMIQSACITCGALGLKKGDKALLCMNLKYIGAKMMVVRALVAGLDLIVRPPSGHPLADLEAPVDFAAMVPLQVYNSLQDPGQKKALSRIGTLIIGGGAIPPELALAIRDLPNRIYSTYGMTETLSHIALRRLNGPGASEYYTPFDTVGLSLSPEGTLGIDSPGITDGPVATNDIAEIRGDGTLRIIGRKDNVINSGGLKLHIEELEHKLSPFISVPFAVTSVPAPGLGEAVVLLSEGAITAEDCIRMHSALTPFELPKKLVVVSALPLAGNGKTDRPACRQIAQESPGIPFPRE